MTCLLPICFSIASRAAPMQRPYRDGATHVVFEPEDFLSRVAALVPSPRVNLTRFHGDSHRIIGCARGSAPSDAPIMRGTDRLHTDEVSLVMHAAHAVNRTTRKGDASEKTPTRSSLGCDCARPRYQTRNRSAPICANPVDTVVTHSATTASPRRSSPLGYPVVASQGIDVLRDPCTNKPYAGFYSTARVAGEVVNSETII